MTDILELSIFHNTILQYLWFFGSFLICAFIIQFLKVYIFKKIYKWTAKKSQIAEETLLPAVKKHAPSILISIVFYFCLKTLNLSQNLTRIIDIILVAVLIYLFALILTAIIDFMLNQYAENKSNETDEEVVVHWISKLLKALLWIFAAILFLNNIGIKIGALMAGLGIGGIAIAYASKAILEDIFSYFMIFFDRPFEVGDFITTGDLSGTVEYIGVRTTRLKSIGGEQLVIPNKDITNSRMKNFKTMEERRIVFPLNLTYDTSIEHLKEIPDIIKKIIEEQEDTRFDRAHFFSYGDSSLNFEVVYFVLSSEYVRYMDIQQIVNLKIKETFDEKGINFAYPSRMIYTQAIQKNET